MNMLMNGLSPVGMIYNQSAENIAYDNNNSVKDMLDKIEVWTNQSPTSNFISQDITISTSDYKYLEIYCKYTTSNDMMLCFKFLKGFGALLNFAYPSSQGSASYTRFVTRISDTKFTIGDCSYSLGTGSPVTANNILIPYKIIAYK